MNQISFQREPLKAIVLTQNSFDNYGNMTKTIVSTFADDDNVQFSRRTTDNLWSDVVLSSWELGNLSSSAVTHARNGKSPVIRKSAFEYVF